jgi:hypothetical protein
LPVRERRPATVGQFVLIGLWRGAVAGGLLGFSVGVFLGVAALTDSGEIPIAGLFFVLLAGLWGLVLGIVPGLVVGAALGAIMGPFRKRFDALWPVAAVTVFLLTFVTGGIIAFIYAFAVQDDPTNWDQALIGCAWALGGGLGLAVAGGLASMGVSGSKSPARSSL